MATNSLHFMKFNMRENWNSEQIGEKLFIYESDLEEDRFIPREITNSVIDGYYVTFVNSKDLIFNSERNSLETIIVKKSVVIPFSIDIENKILDVWSNKINANKLVINLGIRLNHKVQIESISIDLKRIVENLNDSKVKIGKIKIENYQIEKDIVANCIFDLTNHSNSTEIIKKYAKDLVQVALIISDENSELLTMIVYRSGSVVLYKAKDEISQETLENVRKICVR